MHTELKLLILENSALYTYMIIHTRIVDCQCREYVEAELQAIVLL